MSSVSIKSLAPAHYEQWLALFQGYAHYYQFPVTPQSIANTWGWLMNANYPVTGFVAELDDQLVGFAHCRAMPSPLRGEEIGFLDDLYVDPEYRGMGIAEQLIQAVKQEGEEQGWPLVRWITRANNYRAKSLYDQLATKSNWETYEMPLNF